MGKLNIAVVLLSLVLISGCSSGDIWIIGAQIDDNVSANDTTYSSNKINDLISNINVSCTNCSGGSNGTIYYAGIGLTLNSSNYFNINNSYIQSLNNVNLTNYYNKTEVNLKLDNLSTSIINFNQTPPVTCDTALTGQLFFDVDTKALSYKVNGICLQIGEELYITVTNKLGFQINNGQAVYINGVQGSKTTVNLTNTNYEPASYVIGLATENILNNGEGKITTYGLVHDLDTSLWAEGTILYISNKNGNLTSTKEPAPAHSNRVGIVLRQHAIQGVILVNIANSFELDELHNVYLNQSSLAVGSYLTWNGSLWTNSSLDLSNYYTKTQIDNNLSNYYLASNPNNYITDGNTNWNNIYGFITSYTETDPIWTSASSNYYTKTQVDNNFSNYYTKVQSDNNWSKYLLLNDQRFNETSLINSVNSSLNNEITARQSIGNWTLDKVNYNTTLQLDTRYLGINDQRYNDTNRINGVNTTTNIQGLGFNTTTQLNNLYYPLNSNPTGYINTSNLSNYATITALNSVGNWSLDKSSYYTKTQIDTNFTNYYTKTQVDNNLSNYYLTSNPNGYITDGNTNWDNSYGFYNSYLNFTSTLTNGKICIWNSTISKIQCDYTDQTGSGTSDGNNYTSSISFSGLTFTLSRLGMTDLTTTIPLNNYNETLAINSVNTSLNNEITARQSIGNWTLDKVNYYTSTQSNTFFNQSAQANMGLQKDSNNNFGLYTTCGSNQIIKWSGITWACSDDLNSNETSLINGVNTSSNIKGLGFNLTSELDTKYLLLNDQRYNDTVKINAVNTTLNIQSLGFNTTTQLDTKYYLQTNPSGYITDGNTNWDNSYGFYNSYLNFTSTLTNGKICIWNSTTSKIQCDYTDQTSAGGGYATVQDEGTPLTQRTTINFIGTSVNCVDNAGSTRTDCTISGGGSGSPSGASGSLQYNNASAFGGSVYAGIENGYLKIYNATEPTTTTTGLNVFAEDRGQETLFAIKGIGGYDKYMQPNMAYENIWTYFPAESSTATTAPTAWGFTAVAPVGTVGVGTVDGLSFRNSISRTTLTSAAGLTELKPGVTRHFRGNSSVGYDNGGFKLVMRYDVQQADATTAGCYGMVATTTAYTITNNCFNGTTNINGIFVGFNNTQTSLRYFIANATANNVQQVYDCGSNFPIGNISTSPLAVYETTIYAKPNGGNISFYTKRLDNTSIPPCQFIIAGTNTGLPLWNTLLTFRMFTGRNNAAAGTTGVQMGFNKLYLTKDN